MDNDLKLDSQLKTSLEIPIDLLEKSKYNVGYDKETNTWEVIVKYNGNFRKIQEDLNIEIEILSSNYAILTLKKEDIYLLTYYSEIEYIEKPIVLTFVLNSSTTNSCINPVKREPNNLTGKGTIVAILDSGINYLHKDFRNKDGSTRIRYIWDQTVEGNPPDGFLGGSLYTRDDINNALNQANPLQVLPHIDEVGHGTAVAGIAAGNGEESNGEYTGVASNSELIIVKLGERGRESFARNTEIMRGIKFILDKSIELNMPVAINLSFGTNDGSHTGESLFETYIDDMSNIWKTSICVATGNEGYSGHHYRNIAVQNQEIVVEIDVSSNLTSLNIVLFKNFVDLFNIKIRAPNGDETGYINNKSSNITYNLADSIVYFNLGQPVPYILDQGVFFEIVARNQYVTNGIWKIIILGTDIVDGRFDIWLPVTEISSLNTNFLNPNIYTTLTIPSTASNVISVGGYNALNDAIAYFSGRGFTRNGMIKPDLVAPAVNIRTASNFLGYETFSGTSMAAPFVTGSCALLMEWGIVLRNDLFLYGERVKAFLRIGASRKSNLDYPNREWGFGSLCLAETLRFLKIYKQSNISYKSIDSIIKINQIEESEVNLKEKIYSNQYIPLIAEYNAETRRVLQEYDFVSICGVLTGGFVILYIEIDKVASLINEADKMVLQVPYAMGLMDTSALEASGILAVQNQPFLNLKGSGVLVGIIDTGINYTLQEFKYEDNTTKIVSIWDQTIIGDNPSNQCYGTEFTREQINEALKSDNPFEIVPTVDEIGHGTKLASISAGRRSTDKDFIGAAPDAEIVVVKLKQANKNIRDFYNIDSKYDAYDASDLMLGIEYVYQKSLELNKPIAICIGLGTNFGAHNASSILEKYISNIATRNGVCVSVCNGNEGNQKHHSLINFTEVGEEKTIEIRIGENEQGFTLSTIGYLSEKTSVTVISPSGESTGRIPPIENYDQTIYLPLSNTRIRVRYYSNVFQNSGQITLINFIKPSPGIWKVNLHAETILIGKIHSWLPISNFLDKDTYFLESDQFYTVTVPATANFVLAVGGYNSLNNSFFVESGRGPSRLNDIRPILCAPSVNVSCIGNNGDLESLTGTSAGAAIATGCAALLLEWGIVRGNSNFMNSTTVIGTLVGGTKKFPNEIVPSNIWGFGILDILNSFMAL